MYLVLLLFFSWYGCISQRLFDAYRMVRPILRLPQRFKESFLDKKPPFTGPWPHGKTPGLPVAFANLHIPGIVFFHARNIHQKNISCILQATFFELSLQHMHIFTHRHTVDICRIDCTYRKKEVYYSQMGIFEYVNQLQALCHIFIFLDEAAEWFP